MSSEKTLSTMLHDVASNIASLVQSIDTISECYPDNSALVEKMLPLAREKGHQVLKMWEELRSELKNKGC